METTTVRRLEGISKEIARSINNIVEPLIHASEKLYLVGGYLYRNLAKNLYGIALPDKCDIDFLAENIDFQKLPKNWKIDGHNPKGLPPECKGYRIQTESCSFDLSLFGDHASSIMMKSAPSIDTYLKFVPLSIHSIAYDLSGGILIGEIGLSSLTEKMIWFNNKQALLLNREYWTRKIEEKAKELGFVIDLER